MNESLLSLESNSYHTLHLQQFFWLCSMPDPCWYDKPGCLLPRAVAFVEHLHHLHIRVVHPNTCLSVPEWHFGMGLPCVSEIRANGVSLRISHVRLMRKA
ncbi:hypothetical protein AMTRI_Chr01g109540 [Amborella trichopoda]